MDSYIIRKYLITESLTFVTVFLCFASGLVSGCCSLGFDCRNYQEIGHPSSGVHHVTPAGGHAGYNVCCDRSTDGGGWIVFQRRVDGSVDFYRDLNDYELGFGNVSYEHWLGLLPLNRLMSQGRYMYELRIDLEDFEGESTYAKYSFFNIGEKMDRYTLYVTSYTGTAGDGMEPQNGCKFSTKEKDSDNDYTIDCLKGPL